MPEPHDEFYVGYLPMPPRLRRAVRLGVVIGILAVALAAALLAAMQRDPGSAVWDINQRRSFEGVFLARPYPLLVEPGAAVLLLVGEGKRGLPGADEYDGRTVHITGTLLERDGRRLIEVAGVRANDHVARISDTAAASHTPAAFRGRGEIIDPKCFLGAMKPGEGKTHKACASLCLRGGIPPMFVAWNNHGPPDYYLLTNPAGLALVGEELERVIGFVGDDVELTGLRDELGDLRVLRIHATEVRRR